MTNDLAIRILNGDILGTTEQTHEAVVMAVKALSALPSADVTDTNVGNNDLISRQAAIDAIKKRLTMAKYPLNKSKYNEGEIDAYETSISDIDEVPSVEAEPARHGHWIKHENPRLGICMRVSYECSSCGIWLGCENFNRRSYCPNCGARMDGEHDG